MRWIAFLGMGAMLAACGGATEAGDAVDGGLGGGSGGDGGVAGSGVGGASGSGGSAAQGGGGGADPAWYACADAGECTLFASNCCGSYCTEVPITAFTALNRSHLSAFEAASCPDPLACPDCMSAPTPSYASVCRGARCQAIDVRVDELSACDGDADCRLRWGSGCCECGGSLPSELTAVNAQVDFAQAVCGSNLPPCCAPEPYPPQAQAVCAAGHCRVSLALGGP